MSGEKCISMVARLVLMMFVMSMAVACHHDEPVINKETFSEEQLDAFARQYVANAGVIGYNEAMAIAWLKENHEEVVSDASALEKVLDKISSLLQKEIVSSSRSVLVYMVAENSLSQMDDADMREIIAGYADAGIDPVRHQLLVYQDSRIHLPVLYRMIRKADGTVTPEVLYEYSENHNSASPEILREVMNKAFSSCPAESYGFVYWSHGDGWAPYPLKSVGPLPGQGLRWIGIDESSSSVRTNMPELVSVLSSLGKKFEFVMFDACYMLSSEVAYDLREVAEYMIGCPTEVPAPGAPYDAIVPKMFAKNAAVEISESFFDYYASLYDGQMSGTNSHWTDGVSMGTVKLSEMENLAYATRKAFETIGERKAEDIRKNVLNYDCRTSSSHIGYYDFADMMEQLLAPAVYETWKKAFDEAMVYYDTTPTIYSAFLSRWDRLSMEKSEGLSVYILQGAASSVLNTAFRETSWYEAAGFKILGW